MRGINGGVCGLMGGDYSEGVGVRGVCVGVDYSEGVSTRWSQPSLTYLSLTVHQC